MCYVNLRDHSELIHKSIQNLKALKNCSRARGAMPLVSSHGWETLGHDSKVLQDLLYLSLTTLLRFALYLPCLFSCIQCLIDCNINQVMVSQLHAAFASKKEEDRECLERDIGEEAGEYFT